MTINKHDATWLAVTAKANEKLNKLRSELESESASAERTTQIRARIGALKDVLTWADEPAEVRSETIDFGA